MRNDSAFVPRLVFKSVRSHLAQESYQELLMSINRTGNLTNRYPVSSTIYINTLPYAVTVVEPTGKRFQVPPKEHSKYRDVFVIRQNLAHEYIEHNEMINWMIRQAERAESHFTDTKHFKEDSVGDNNPESYFSMYWLAKEFGDRKNPKKGWGNSNIWSNYFEDFVVAGPREFESRIVNGLPTASREIYHSPTGVLISSLPLDAASLNPNDPLYSNRERIEVLEENGRISCADAAVRFELVSKKHTYAPRYVKLGSRVEKLTPKNNPLDNREDGIYFTYLEKDSFSDAQFDVRVEFCPLEEAAQRYGVYLSYDEALNHGFVDKKITLRNKELEDKVAQLNQEKENTRIKNENERLRLEQKIQILEQKVESDRTVKESLAQSLTFAQKEREHEREQARRAAENIEKEREAYLNERKFESEKKTADRRDASEVFKIISTLLVGMVGLLALIKKSK